MPIEKREDFQKNEKLFINSQKLHSTSCNDLHQ